MNSGMYSLGMFLDNLSAIANVLPVPVGPTHRTYNMDRKISKYMCPLVQSVCIILRLGVISYCVYEMDCTEFTLCICDVFLCSVTD